MHGTKLPLHGRKKVISLQRAPRKEDKGLLHTISRTHEGQPDTVSRKVSGTYFQGLCAHGRRRDKLWGRDDRISEEGCTSVKKDDSCTGKMVDRESFVTHLATATTDRELIRSQDQQLLLRVHLAFQRNSCAK